MMWVHDFDGKKDHTDHIHACLSGVVSTFKIYIFTRHKLEILIVKTI